MTQGARFEMVRGFSRLKKLKFAGFGFVGLEFESFF
jgi:hypothetical protein